MPLQVEPEGRQGEHEVADGAGPAGGGSQPPPRLTQRTGRSIERNSSSSARMWAWPPGAADADRRRVLAERIRGRAPGSLACVVDRAARWRVWTLVEIDRAEAGRLPARREARDAAGGEVADSGLDSPRVDPSSVRPLGRGLLTRHDRVPSPVYARMAGVGQGRIAGEVGRATGMASKLPDTIKSRCERRTPTRVTPPERGNDDGIVQVYRIVGDLAALGGASAPGSGCWKAASC